MASSSTVTANRLHRLIDALASPLLAILVFGLIMAGALATGQRLADATWLMALPFGLLTLNLVAAIWSRPRLRASLSLLVFHLALLALIVLWVVARLVYFEGGTTLVRGSEFAGRYDMVAAGQLHGEAYRHLRFANEGFVERQPGTGRYVYTRNRIRWEDGQGVWHPAVIGDDDPLLIEGYRIYATRRRGYAPVMTWQGHDGTTTQGAVQIDKFGTDGFVPGMGWSLPDGTQVWATIVPDDPAQAKIDPMRFTVDLNAARLAHHLILYTGERRNTLRPGETLELPTGRLTYNRLETWISYRVVYDPTESWVAAAVLIAIASLIAYYARQFARSGFTEGN